MTQLSPTLYYRVLAATLITGIAAFTYTVWYAGNRATQERDKLCAVLYQMVDRQGRTLGRPGTPGHAYYTAHPAELVLAKRQAGRSLNELPCGPP